MQSVIADVCLVDAKKYELTIYKSSGLQLSEKGMGHSVALLQIFLSMELPWSGPKDDTTSTEETQDGRNNSFQTIEEETKGTDREDAQTTQAELEQKGVCVCVCVCMPACVKHSSL